MDKKIETKIIELGNKYIPLLDSEIALAEKQLELTRQKHFDRKLNKVSTERMERE